MRSRALVYVAYPTFFLTCFLVSLYLTFPMDVVKPRIVEELTRQLNARKNPGPYGKPGRILVNDLTLWRVTGIQMTGVTVFDVTTDPDPASPIELDKVQARVGILGLLRKTLNITFNVEAYDGTASGNVVLAGEGFRELKLLKAEADGISWGKIAVIRDKLKVPTAGHVGGDVDLTLGKDIKEAKGVIHLRGEGLGLGPGEVNVPAFGALTLPKVDMGKLTGEITVADGKTAGPPITLVGQDVQAAADVPTQLKTPVDNSPLNGMFQFKLSEAFLKSNPKYATVFDLTPQLKNARDEEGVFHFRLKGVLARPDARPDRGAKINLK